MTITRLYQYTAETRVLSDLTVYGSNPDFVTISATQARTGGYAYRVGTGAGPFGYVSPNPLTQVRLGYWLYHNEGVNLGDGVFLYHANDGGGQSSVFADESPHIAVSWNDESAQLRIIRPNANNSFGVLATANVPGGLETINVWNHLGFAHKVHETTGFLYGYLNGALILAYDGDTRPSYWDGVGGVLVYKNEFSRPFGPGMNLWGSQTDGFKNYAYVDDFYVDATPGEPVGPVPARRFLLALPNGAGDNAAWTPQGAATNHEAVDENPNDGDTTFNQAAAAGLTDTLAVADIALPAEHVIRAVIALAFAKKTDSLIDSQLRLVVDDGVNTDLGVDQALTVSYNTPIWQRFPLTPAGVAWQEGSFNAMQFGYEARGAFV